MANNRFKTIGPNASMEELANHNKNWDTVDTALTSVESGIRDKQANIDAEARAREEAIANEKAARIEADNKEAQARIDAVNQEAQARSAADMIEAQARSAADTLETQQRIESVNAEASVRATADATETQARIAADAAHQNSTAAHDADNITFTPGSSGLTSTKAGPAIREVKAQLQNIISSQVSGKDNELIAARMGYDGVARPSLDVMVKELHQNEFTLENAIAELTRQQVMSGVIDYVSSIKIGLNSANNGIPYGQIAVTNTGNTNRIDVGFFNAIVNGYKIPVSGFNNAVGANVNIINLNAAPTYGYREDLVFLEAWFPQTGPKGILSWRIRVIDGVDFTKYDLDGFARKNESGYLDSGQYTNNLIAPQGGNSSPIALTDINYVFTYNNQRKQGWGNLVSIDDVGLYVAGRGNAASKATLQTGDGYVYAVPLFRIKRRNSGGYRKDNLNGARDFFETSVIGSNVNFSAAVPVDITVTSTIGFKAGEKVNINTGSSNILVTINEVKSSTTLNITSLTVNGVIWVSYKVQPISDRPDGLYANIIDASDIVDLRHKVSLTGVNYQQVLEESFDNLLRGELITKDTKTIQKEVYGLRRAPLGITQELMPTTIIRADGSSVDLVNLLGIVGRCEDINKYSSVAGGTVTLDTSSKLYGTSSVQGITNVTTGTLQNRLTVPAIDSSKYYIVILEINNVSMVGTYARVMNIDGANLIKSNSANPVTATGWKTHYLKLSPTELAGITSFRIDACGIISATGQKMNVDGLRLYQIDQTTYNLIDVDPNWTGADKIGVLFPYVDSHPNFVENLFDGQLELGHYDIITGVKTASTNTRSTNLIPVKIGTYTFSNLPADKDKYALRYSTSGAYLGYSSIGTLAINVSQFNITVNEDGFLSFYFVSTQDTGIKVQLEKQNIGFSYPSPFVPYGRYYLDKDYLANGHLNNNQLPTYHYEGVNGGNFNGQRLVYSDAQTSQAVIDVVEALKTPQRHIKVTQATEGQWANGDKIVISSDYGMISGVGTVYRISSYADGGTVSTSDYTKLKLLSVSGLSVNDSIRLVSSNKAESWISDMTITSIDASANVITLSNSTIGAGDISSYSIIKTNTLPSISYTAQQNKTAQSGSTSTTIKLSADASVVDNYYKDLLITIISGTGVGQVRTISGYVGGSTKTITVSSAWTIIPDATSVYSISISGTWTNLGTKSATFTIGNVPTATESTLGDANKLNITISSSVNYPAGRGMSYVPTDVLKAEVNGQELLASNTVSVKANFSGKASGNTDLVPHTFKGASSGSMLAPSSGSWTERATSEYNQVSTLDGISHSVSTMTSTAIGQVLFSFDLIRTIEDKYGEIPADGTAAKVAWLKANISSITCDWWGYGSGPAGNKAYLAIWNVTNSNWNATAILSHLNTTVAILSYYRNIAQSPSVLNNIDSNGFTYFLAYADTSDGTIASTINTDYIEFSIALKTSAISAFDNSTDASGYTVLQPTNPFPVLSENLLTQNQAFPVDLTGLNATSFATLSIESLGVLTATLSAKPAFEEGININIPAVKKGQIFTFSGEYWVPLGKSGSVRMYEDTDGIYLTTQSFVGNGNWVKFSISRTLSNPNITSLNLYVRLGASNVAGDIVKVRNLKLVQGALSSEWTPGRKKKSTLNLLGKSKGSTVENPHRALVKTVTTFDSPSSFSIEAAQSDYDSLTKQDGIISMVMAAGVGQYAQMLYEFDLSYLGLSLSELKSAIRKISVFWTGFGYGDNAGAISYGITLKAWDTINNNWTTSGYSMYGTSTSNTPTTITRNTSSNVGSLTHITKDQKVYVLVHSTYPSSATLASSLLTDYVKLDVELADYVDYVPANIVKVRPETREIKTFFPSVSRRYLGGNPRESEQIALWYRYNPYQGAGDVSKTYKILALGDPWVTTVGTGKGSPYATNSPILVKPITSILPTAAYDYTFYADDIVLKNDLFSSSELDMYTQGAFNFRRIKIDSFRYGSPVGKNVNFLQSLSGTVAIRGFKPNTSNELRSLYQNLLISNILAKPINKMVMVPLLAMETQSGELMLIIETFTLNGTQLSFWNYNHLAVDAFKLPGRPLMKGV